MSVRYQSAACRAGAWKVKPGNLSSRCRASSWYQYSNKPRPRRKRQFCRKTRSGSLRCSRPGVLPGAVISATLQQIRHESPVSESRGRLHRIAKLTGCSIDFGAFGQQDASVLLAIDIAGYLKRTAVWIGVQIDASTASFGF